MSKRSIAEAHSELERELKVREKCFVDWVARGKMSRTEAVDRFERLESALYLLTQMLNQLGDAAEEPTIQPMIHLNWPTTTGVQIRQGGAS